jgi:hypothetical protein
MLATLALLVLGGANGVSRASVDSNGAEAKAGGSHWAVISKDGRFVAFQSGAKNLVPADTNASFDVFVRDLQTGATSRVSVDSNGVEGDDHSYMPAISADGRHVAFYSRATNFWAIDTNFASDVFVHDRVTGQTEMISQDVFAAPSNGPSYNVAVSDDGNLVAFLSYASDLVAVDANGGTGDIFVRDRQAGLTTLVSVRSNGKAANGPSDAPAISGDGRFVGFHSEASNLVAGDTNGSNCPQICGLDVFVHELSTGKTERVSVSASGAQGNFASRFPSLSTDGRFVAFQSHASNLVPVDANGTVPDILVRDRASGAVQLATVSSSGAQANQLSGGGPIGWLGPRLAPDGSAVTFHSKATNLASGGKKGTWDVFLRDLGTGVTTLVNPAVAGSANGDSSNPAISGDGRLVVYESKATNLIAQDTNNTSDVFVYDRDPAEISAYCTAKTNSLGCAPSIGALGLPCATVGVSFDVVATDVLSHKVGALVYSTLGAATTPFGGGTLCVTAPFARTPMALAGGGPPPTDCSGVLVFDFNAFIASGVDPALVPGQRVYAQVLSRDRASVGAYGLTDGLAFTILP